MKYLMFSTTDWRFNRRNILIKVFDCWVAHIEHVESNSLIFGFNLINLKKLIESVQNCFNFCKKEHFNVLEVIQILVFFFINNVLVIIIPFIPRVKGEYWTHNLSYISFQIFQTNFISSKSFNLPLSYIS